MKRVPLYPGRVMWTAGHEGEILRYVFFDSLALAGLIGLLVMAQALSLIHI